MIPLDLIKKLSEMLKIEEIGLIEKDLYLQGLLLELEKSDYFAENFAFKGGTCLTKAYFGYYRFSEDLDFTWINSKEFETKSEKETRRILSKEIDKIGKIFEPAAKTLELDFKPEKHNTHFIQLGGSNRFATFKFWYNKATDSQPTFIKIQLNFVEKIIHKPKKHELKPLLQENKEEIELEYPKFAEMATKSATVYAYDLKEIASEKIRALLTRRGFKARDITDLYVLSKEGITINSVKAMAIEKTKFMLKYLKYAENLKNKKFDEKFNLGTEQKLLVQSFGNGFQKFAEKTLKELNELAEEIRKNE